MPYWRLFYHIVFGTKGGHPMITAAIEDRLLRYIHRKAEEMGGIVHAINGTETHIHIAVSVPPKIALTDFIARIKGSSSHYVNHSCQPIPMRFAWQTEYGLLSFGEKQLEWVVEYIKNQKEHHRQGTVLGGLEYGGWRPAAKPSG